jgi:osmotically-inducible protein OsmY
MRHAPARLSFAAALAGLVLIQATGPALTAEAPCKDALITRIVQTRLSADREIGQFRIDVTTSDCVVTLRGCVESRDQAKKAKELAKRLVKVKVKNDLTVCTIAPRKAAARIKKS